MSRRLEDPARPLIRRTLQERIGALAVTVLALNLVFLLIFIAGWFAGWFQVSLGRNEANAPWRLQVTLNPRRVADDLRETASTLQAASEVDTVIGEVVKHDLPSNRITVETEQGQQVTARINDATQIPKDGNGDSPSTFQAGDRIELVYREQEGQNHAVQIARVERN